MLFKNIAAIAAVSTLVDAFLIPPQISKADTDIISTLPFEIAAEGVGKIVDLKCNGCPVPAVNMNGNLITLQHVESTLQLNYTVEQNVNQADRLLLNGVSIYPPNMASIEPFKASQKFSKDQPFETQENVRLGYEMSLRPIKKDKADLELIAVDIHIFEVADKFIDGIDSVELQMIKTPSGKLMIASCVKKPSKSATPMITDGKDCTSMICKWQSLLAAKLAHLKPLKGCGKGKIAGHKSQGRPHPHSGRPHGQHHGGHRHHRHLFRFKHMLRGFAFHILLPISVGLAAGLFASAVGMVFGHLIVITWRAIRGRRPTYSLIEQDDISDEENKVLVIEPQGPPPIYEDVVVIEDATEEKRESDA